MNIEPNTMDNRTTYGIQDQLVIIQHDTKIQRRGVGYHKNKRCYMIIVMFQKSIAVVLVIIRINGVI